MAYYTGTATRPDRAKAIAAVVAVHAALAAALLTGLNVSIVRETVERMTTIDIREPPPPPPVKPPPPAPKPQAKKPAGAPAPKAEPSPVVAPPPRIPAPSPIPAAKIAGTGSATSSGGAASGNGTGAGGAGNGAGAGGGGAVIPARMISKIPDYEYRRLSSTGIRRGSAGLAFHVAAGGWITNCSVVRSSGDTFIDQLACELAVRYIRFDPARDASGRAVPFDLVYFPNWWRR